MDAMQGVGPRDDFAFHGLTSMDDGPLLRRTLRAILCANVRSGILSPQSRLRGNNGFFDARQLRCVDRPGKETHARERERAGDAGPFFSRLDVG